MLSFNFKEYETRTVKLEKMIEGGEHISLIDKILNATDFNEFKKSLEEMYLENIEGELLTKAFNKRKTIDRNKFINLYEMLHKRSFFATSLMLGL